MKKKAVRDIRTYKITGMTCAACSSRVEKAISRLEGVKDVSVNLLTQTANVEGNVADDDVIRAVINAGYGVAVSKTQQKRKIDENDLTDKRQIRNLLYRFIASLVCLLPHMYISMGHMIWDVESAFKNNHLAMGLAQLMLSTIIIVINQQFFISGFKALAHFSPNMDTLVSVGASVSYGYSVCVLFAMTFEENSGDTGEFYFESASMILTLITLGKLLEAYSKGKTTNAIAKLMKLAPKTTTVLRDGVELVIPTDEVIVGDIFHVRPGEAISVDGVVIEGESFVDEAMLTGESIPVEAAPGAKVYAGTINKNGFLKCRTVKVGEDTTLSSIVKMVTDASAGKAQVSKVADKVSGIFVPVVIAIAVVTFTVWILAGYSTGFALARATAVLVISCPCALGLATPVAIMVGNGVAAKNNVLFKNALSLELTGKIKTIALDKTGTITMGKPRVTDIVFEEDEKALLEIAYILEARSEHPLAYAVMEYCREKSITGEKLTIDKFVSHTGMGVEAVAGEKSYYAGNIDFIKKYAKLEAKYRETGKKWAADGKTPIYVAVETKTGKGKILGAFAIADAIKPDSIEAIRQLKKLGIKTVMLTGDNVKTAEAIGNQVKVDQVMADVRPDEKDRIVRRLQNDTKKPVAMVGDGINDAPALTRADVGIAIGTGTDIAIDSADVVLMKSSLMDVVTAIKLSRATLKNIHENLFWAFIYNVAGIPLAAGVWYPAFGLTLSPMFAAAAMSLSSVCVVTNALRLNLFKSKNTLKPVDNPDNKMKGEKTDMEKENFKIKMSIKGMMCGHCEANVKKALEEIEGVEEALVSHEDGNAIITLAKNVDTEILKSKVTEAGYEVTGIE